MTLPRSVLLLLLTLTTASFRIPEVSALKGDSWCGTLMCVDATVNGSVVTCAYYLSFLHFSFR